MEEEICKFLCEMGQLRRIRHEGWRLCGVEKPESVAEHSLRAAQIGYILAKLEGYENPEEICTALVFHDIAECRIGDLHKVARRYVGADEERAVKEQTKKLGKIGEDIFSIWRKFEHQDEKAGVIAKDADLLEMAFTAKEYVEIGYESAMDWIEKISKRLKTKSARKLLEILMKRKCLEWWQGLKKL